MISSNKGQQKRIKHLIFIALSLFIFNQSYARHIIGGEVTYTCNGDGSYTFTMFIYRDCLGQGADFDSAPGALVGTVTLFRNGIVEDRLNLRAPQEDDVEPMIDNPCVEVPDDVCVERARYEFTATLPSSPDNYTVSYQRCCRNVTIDNILQPESTGATYSIDLIPRARELCNSSPSFNNFPPIVICAGEPLIFDHGASDIDGDQLIYEFCAPFVGGGLAGSGQGNGGSATDPDGVAPDPETSPPYTDVSFVLPTYTPIAPLAGDPVVSINPNTGLITGTPRIQGQFVVGVCVSEFRNGELLSVVKRDFQFNVTNCDPLVRADILEDAKIGDREFVLNSCGENEIFFKNESVDRSNITQWEWEFDILGNVTSIRDWDATVTFPDTGLYMGNLFLNPGTECGDTATIFVNVFPEIVAEYDLDFDTCIAGPVSFTDFSFTGAPAIVEWDWDFGDGSSSSAQNPIHIYEDPGTLRSVLRVTDTNDCVAEIDSVFLYAPVPNQIIVQPSSFIGCSPGEVFFDNLSFPIDSTYDIFWDFGDGGTSTEISPTHVFEQPGTFSISVDIVSPFGCETDREFFDFVSIKEGPLADFTFSPRTITSINPEVSFTDLSQLADSWQWQFGTQGASRDQNPTFTFRDTGLQEIILLVTHENGCQDTAFALIDVQPIVNFFLPNAFTPNNDSKNDLFMGVGTLADLVEYEMLIWDRWGELIFRSTDPFEGWNGKKNNVGRDEPNGVYVAYVTYRDPRGQEFEIKGYATLIR